MQIREALHDLTFKHKALGFRVVLRLMSVINMDTYLNRISVLTFALTSFSYLI
jgi:hypothetical protein